LRYLLGARFSIGGVRSEQGGVMVFVAASLVVLVFFLAYVIDLGALVLANERARQFARFAAMGAIEGYMSKKCEELQGCVADRLVAAVERANDVSAKNKLFNQQEPLSVSLGDDPNQAKLTPGVWWVMPPTNTGGNGNQNPCNGEYPCFEPIPDPGENTGINAFRVDGLEDAFGGISGFFSGLFGTNFFAISVSATATVIPRRGYLLVDISNSTTRETHLSNNGPQGSDEKASRYAFLNGDSLHQGIFNGLVAERGQNSTVPTIHYQDDYVPIAHYVDDDYQDVPIKDLHPDPNQPSGSFNYSVGSIAQTYDIDAFRGGEAYGGPEPLQTILAGGRYLVERFQARAVAGDRLGIIFYDDKLLWPRVVKPTSDFEAIDALLNNEPLPGGPEANQEEEDSTSPFVTAAKHILFPLKGSKTNTLLALLGALDQLNKDQLPGVVTSDFIVNISDGRSTCFPADQNGAPLNYSQPSVWNSPFGWKCLQSYTGYKNSIEALTNYVTTQLVPKTKIPIHMVLVGKDSGPNTIDIQKNDGEPAECFTDAEIRLLSKDQARATVKRTDLNIDDPFDEWNAAFNQTEEFENIPFYQASYDMFNIALETGGLWLPVRGVCQSPDTQALCVPGEVRLDDPKCRTVEQQIFDAMDEIMGQSPYAIVE
jgi:hypothetical protein